MKTGYFKTSVAKALKDPITTVHLETALLLVDTEVSREFLCRWSLLQRAIAEDWAIRLHLNASDNCYVRVPPKPGFVTWAERRSKKLTKARPSLFTETVVARSKKMGTLWELLEES